MISGIVAAIVAILAAAWGLSRQLAEIQTSLKSLHEDVQEIVPMVHGHETRITVVEDKLNQ